MKKTTWLSFILVYLIVFFLLTPGLLAAADLPVQNLQSPREETMQVLKVIFSKNSNKLALLLQESRPGFKREQAIYVYDFSTKKWIKVVGIANGSLLELEPLVLNSDGSKLVYRQKNNVTIYDLQSNMPSHWLKDVGSMTRAAFSHDNKKLALLINAEWEMLTGVGVIDMSLTSAPIMPVVTYKAKNKAAGPLSWMYDGSGFYYIEEYAYGTVNSSGVLIGFTLEDEITTKVYTSGAPTVRVINYFYSQGDLYRALILKFYDDTYQNSEYALLIQRQGQFYYGEQLKGWRDSAEVSLATDFSLAGWVGTWFYWANYNMAGTEMNIYDVAEKKITVQHFPGHVYMSPTGVIIKFGR